jgi:flagellar basal-body rod protein FlgB
MPVTDLPLFAMLKTRMYWLEERQKLLAENVANADTAGYRGRDLKQLDFNAALRSASSVSSVSSVTLAATAPGHLSGAAGSEATRFASERGGGFEVTPRGNAVTLEEEMMKLAQNQMDHQAATALYARGLGMIKAALGRK